MQATLGFLQHYTAEAASLRASIAAVLVAARDQAHAILRSMRSSHDMSHLDAHLRRDIGVGEFGTSDVAALHVDAVRT